MNAIDPDNRFLDGSEPDSSDVVAAVEAYQDALRRGRSVDRAAFLNKHAEFAGQLAECLDALELIQSVAGAPPPGHCSEIHQSPLEPGDILGEYRILHEVARGGMGVVYEAVQLGLPERRVALKVLLSASSLDARTLQRFRIETQAAACLNHPNIVPVFAAGCERGIPYYAMPLIKGRSLAEMLGMLRAERQTGVPSACCPGMETNSSDPWPVVVARLGLQAAEALEHAHSLGIVHRDIKPSNLLVDTSGRLWVTDFGLARVARDETALTCTGDLVGTLRYMSPEQVRGEPGAGNIESDIYALGVTLYEALALRPVFDVCEREALLLRILHDEPLPLRAIDATIPRDVETIVLKAMDKVASGRYAMARELADDLRRFLDDRPIRARRPNPVERALRWSKKHRALLATAIVGIIVSMGSGTLALWRAKQQSDASLFKIRAARVQERLAFEGAFSITEAITVPLLDDATDAGVWDPDRRLYSLRQLIAFYDRLGAAFAADEHQLEVSAKSAYRAGALRMTIGDCQGRKDYDRAITLYEAMAAQTPAAIWYRTGLIFTLRDYAYRLDNLGYRRTALDCRRRAYEIAEGLLVDDNAALPCFRRSVIPEFNALLEMLSDDGMIAADRTLADRLKTWLVEHP